MTKLPFTLSPKGSFAQWVQAINANFLHLANALDQGFSAVDHGGLSGLADDDHTQYTLADGSRAFTGDVSLGGNNITSVGSLNGTLVSNYLTTADEGAGNGLDADQVDGYDANGLLARANHTGTQTLSTISDAGTAASYNVPATGDAASGEVVKGDDTRLTDARTPSAHASSHAPGGSDALPWTTVHGYGTTASRPAAASTNTGYLYYSTDDDVFYRSNGTTWDTLDIDAVDADTVDGSHAADLLARANHTGTQTASTISDFSSTVQAESVGGDVSGTVANIAVTDDSHNHTLSTITDAGTAAASAATDFVAVTGDTMTGALTVQDTVTVQSGQLGQVQISPTTGTPQIIFGSAADTNLYRSAANTLKTDDALTVGLGLNVLAGDIDAEAGDVYASTAVMGDWPANSAFAAWGHESHWTSTNYALLQAATGGSTYLNAAAGATLYLRVGNANVLSMDGTTATFADNVDMGGNNITNIGTLGADLADLDDTTFTSLTSNDVLTWNGSAWINQAAGAPGAHASGHITGGGDEIDGDQLDIDYTPSFYVPDTTPAEVSNVDHASAHLAGIDNMVDLLGADDNGTKPISVTIHADSSQVSNDSWKRDTNGPGWTSGLYSDQGHTDGCYVRWTCNATNKDLMVGLNTDPSTSWSYTDIDYAFHCLSDGTVDVYASGSQLKNNVQSYTTSTLFEIRYTGSMILWLIDGKIVWARERQGDGNPLYMDVAFYTNDAQINDVRFGATSTTNSLPEVSVAMYNTGTLANASTSIIDYTTGSTVFHDPCNMADTANDQIDILFDGVYLVWNQLQVTYSGTYLGGTYIYYNGSTMIGHQQCGTQGGYFRGCAVGIYALSAGDYLDQRGYQNSGTTRNIIQRFGATLLSPVVT